MITTYRKLTPPKAFAIAREAERAGNKCKVDEDKDGLTVTVEETEVYCK